MHKALAHEASTDHSNSITRLNIAVFEPTHDTRPRLNCNGLFVAHVVGDAVNVHTQMLTRDAVVFTYATGIELHLAIEWITGIAAA
jgi:hypothetical protein